MLGAFMSQELPKNFDPKASEKAIYQRWLEGKCFRALPDASKASYVIMMPLPNVTGALHMGHAMDNVMQDLLIRWHRMKGDDTLWQPGTDHAGIATQAVVEKRLFELEGKTRHDIGRDALVERIFAWKDEYQTRIIQQQQKMGCSCDWDRQRFTMDPVCRAAVREMFFRMFSDGLIFRGNRLVNWDCHLHTAVSDDEIEHRTVQGHFWHLRYPVVNPKKGEPAFVVVATTRPETMLGDTAIAVHPKPRAVLGDEPSERLVLLENLVRMAKEGRKVLVPLIQREVPLILDEWAKPEKGSGCVKITPAHDPNDYEVWKRHSEEISAINILNIDGSLNERAGPYAGLDRFVARKKVLADLESQGFLESIEDREIEVGHSDRSKTPIEPLLSKQWFVRMGDLAGGVLMGRGTDKEHRSPGLAQAAIDAVAEGWKSPSGLQLRFHPERYEQTYVSWLSEKRDWCISRQLWWGHRIPIWHGSFPAKKLLELWGKLPKENLEQFYLLVQDPDGGIYDRRKAPDVLAAAEDPVAPWEIQICLRNEEAERTFGSSLEDLGLARDPDVLDTWFSSALWPQSTLGWPDPEHAPIEEGQAFLGAVDGRPSSLDRYYPGSCLVTGRDIITLWVARMVLAGLYNLGDLPFTDVFIHANILDGKGVRMSKSKGNGIDPLDIIDRYGADAMRYVLCEMQTGLQDIRLPVQAITPFHEEYVDLTRAKPGQTLGVYIDPKTGKEFDVIGTRKDLPQAKVISDRFEVGRNFCNKLWNALRFAMLNLEDCPFESLDVATLKVEDRWILSRLTAAIQEVEKGLQDYLPANAIQAARDFFWGELCDWYLELLKPRFKEGSEDPEAQQVLAFVLDQVLRLLHPALPFITETLYGHLGLLAPRRGIEEEQKVGSLLIRAEWPSSNTGWRNEELEGEVTFVQETLRGIRDLRARYQVPPKKRLPAVLNVPESKIPLLEHFRDWILHLGGLSRLEIGSNLARPELAATAVAQECEISLGGVLDPQKERERLEKQKAKLEAHIQGLEGKLSNENFTKRAPAEVVERERLRLDELRAELALVLANLEAFL
jgi:valyl-tRNA synthetase